ncbi:MAG: cation:dicarboxylate symporter family transporter [Bacilli bacterium]
MFEGYTLLTIIGLVVIALIYAGMRSLKKYNLSFGMQVLIGLGLGIIFGFILIQIKDKEGIEALVSWLSLIGSAFTGLLRMIVVPLILVMIITSIVNMPQGSKKIKTWLTRVVAILVGGALLGAIVGIVFALIFKLDASAIVGTEAISSRAVELAERAEMTDTSFVGLIKSFIPANPFADLAGSRPTSMIGVVIFAAFLGFGGYILLIKEPKSGNVFKNVMNSFKDVIMIVVNAIIKLTPYGVFALIANTFYTTDFDSIKELGKFVGASYLSIIVTFIIVLIPLVVLKLSPITYIKKSWETLVFAFSSRSSAATVPKTYTTQSKFLGVEDGLASLSSSLGASIGQTGCAGIYPAMLAIMIAVSEGVTIDFAFVLKLLIVIAVTSFAAAGVGGGATNAAIIVLVAMDLPIALAAVLIAVEPIIDMARTALNVNGSIIAGVVTAATTDSLDREVYNSKNLNLE